MRDMIIRRALASVPVVLIVTMLAFSLLFMLPGDPTVLMVSPEEGAPDEVLAEIRHELGLDRPIYVQYVNWLVNILGGEAGFSFRTNLPITEEVWNRAPVTLELGILATLVALLISIPIGVITAARPNTFADVSGTIFAMAGVAMPHFWLGILLILLFSVTLGWVPAAGYVPIWEDPWGNVSRMMMPSFALGASHAASLMRQTRSSMMEVLGQDYIRTAHAKGLTEIVVLSRHALRNAMIPVITVLGMQTSRIIGGAVVIETLFQMPGIGKFVVEGVMTHDYLVVQGVLLLVGLWVILFNLLTDIAYGVIDPRIRYNN